MPPAEAPVSIWITGTPAPRALRRAGTFADMIRATVGDAWPGAWSVVDATDASSALPAPDTVAGVILTGSPARIADQAPWMRRTQQALRLLVEYNVPVLGICFGHQLLGMALGGSCGPNPHGREIGTVTLTTRRIDPLLAGPCSMPVAMTHLDIVQKVPAGAVLLASTALDPHAAIRFGETAWGVQFHPEMEAAVLRDYVDTLREQLVAERIDPESVLADVQDTPRAAELLVRFAYVVRERGQNPK